MSKATALRRQHAALCFQRAFPASAAEYRQVLAALADFDAGGSLADSGIAGTRIHYPFSFAVARWLARKAPGQVAIDWDAISDTDMLDDLLRLLRHPAEEDYFESGSVTSREWIDLARAGQAGTDFDWLLAQLGSRPLRSHWSQLYDAIELPLVWHLGDCRYSKTRNMYSARPVQLRAGGMRRRPRFPKRDIQRPVDAVTRLPQRAGTRLIDVAMAALAVRHRETYHFNFANPAEVYLADVGNGVAVAVFGLLPEYRFPLECTLGYLILSNGVPIGYGGSSMLFRQVNTGINIFDEYRGSEAAYLWVQVMRVYHTLLGCNRFIVNPYQIGGDNAEGLRSGAFWFYYRLGFRPQLVAMRKLAQREAARLRRNKTYRSDLDTLQKLASCDMHLVLPGARSGELFAERWIETSSMLATGVLAGTGCVTRAAAAKATAAALARDLGLTSIDQWSATEQRAFTNIAPVVAAADPLSWSADARRTLLPLLRAKGAAQELEFARLLGRHDDFLHALQQACKRAERD
jgi:hypothetical protein